MQVIIAAEQQNPQWLYGSTYAYLRIYASTDFYTSDGISITGGQVGSPNWYQQYTCTVSGTTLTIPQVTLQSTTDSTVEAATYTAVLFDSRGTQRNIKLQNFRVDPSLAPASTWQALAMFNQGTQLNFFNQTWTIPQIVGYIDTRIGTSTTPYASSIVVGKSYLDTDPVVPTDPIVVGANSNRIEKNLSSDYGNSFATAISDINTDEVTLVVKNPVTISANTTIPANITLNVIDGGLITVNASRTLTVNSLIDPGNRQIIALADATAHILIARGAVDKFNVAWIAGSSDLSTTLTEAIACVNANGRGTIYIPSGEWTTNGGHALTGGITVEGDGFSTAGIGTRITLTSTTTSIFTIGENIYDVLFCDLVLDGDSLSATDGILCTGTFPNSSRNIRCEGVKFENFTHGFRLLGSGGWQTASISFDAFCVFANCSHSGIRCNSANSGFTIQANFFVPAGAWATYFEGVGATVFRGCEFAGDGYFGSQQYVKQTVAGTVSGNGNAKTVITYLGMIGSPLTVTFPVTTALTTPSLVAQAFRDAMNADATVAAYFQVVGTGADVGLVTLDPESDDPTFNFTIENATCSGITTSATATKIDPGNVSSLMSEGVCYVSSAHPPITFIGCQDEAFKTFIENDASDLDSIFALYGNLIQSPIRLNASCTVTSSGNRFLPKVFRDGTTSSANVNSFGDIVIDYIYTYAGTQLFTVPQYSNMTGIIGSADILFAIDNIAQGPVIKAPFKVYQNDRWFTFDADPVAEILTTRTKPQLRIGRCTPMGDAEFYYDIGRNNGTGILEFTGNQTGFQQYTFDGAIATPSLVINGGTALTTTNRTGTGNLVLATTPTLTTPVIGVATGTSLALGGGTALTTTNRTGTGNLVLATTPTLTTPVIGVATGTSLAVTGKVTSSSPTAGIGYVTGSGSTTTGTWGGAATINTITGQITMNNPGFSANTSYYVNVANSAYVAGATVVANIVGGATDPSQYGVSAAYASAGHFYICIRSYTAVSETLVFQFTIMLGATS